MSCVRIHLATFVVLTDCFRGIVIDGVKVSVILHFEGLSSSPISEEPVDVKAFVLPADAAGQYMSRRRRLDKWHKRAIFSARRRDWLLRKSFLPRFFITNALRTCSRDPREGRFGR